MGMKGWKVYWVLILSGWLTGACGDGELYPPEEIPGTETIDSDTAGKEPPENADVYTIRKGRHYPVENHFQRVKTDQLNFRAKFDSSAIYTTADPANQGDINKLLGTADCNDFHQNNSARFGWRWYDGQLQIWAYCYTNGERNFKLIDAVSLNKFYNYSIAYESDRYIFKLGDVVVEMPRACNEMAQGYKLLPYFGGNEPAPHDIKILIAEE